MRTFHLRLLGLLCVILTSPVYAFSCFLTMVKDDCWDKYTVKVTALDASTQALIADIIIPARKNWVRVPFTCVPEQKLMYTATFSPTVWAGKEDIVYKARHFWMLPSTPKSTAGAWNIPVCFPADFAEVPTPPLTKPHCQCNMSEIPPVPPQNPTP